MLEARGGGRKLESAPVIAIGKQTVDKPRGEGITSSDAVDNVGDLVLAAGQHLVAVVHHGRPPIAIGAVTLSQRDHLLLEIGKCVENGLRDSAVSLRVELTATYIDFALNAERFFAVLFIGNADVHLAHD